MFGTLSDRLSGILSGLTRRGSLTEEDVNAALREVRRALLEAGVDMDTIDAAIKETAGFPMGPFELLDVVGNDVSLAIQRELHREFGEPGFEPAATLVAKVEAGDLGRKTGRGFHDYS